MNVTRLMTAAAFAALIAGPVAAQQTSTNQPTDNEGQSQTQNQSPTLGTTTSGTMSTGTTTTGTATSGTLSTGTMTTGTTTTGSMGASTSLSTTGGAMTSGVEVQVVANAPIPDTAENRARYGQPESRAGRARIGEGPVQSLSRSGS